MDRASANPLIVVLFFVLRCIIPLVLMLGVSYLLRKLGLVAPPAQEPEERETNGEAQKPNETMTHGGA